MTPTLKHLQKALDFITQVKNGEITNFSYSRDTWGYTRNGQTRGCFATCIHIATTIEPKDWHNINLGLPDLNMCVQYAMRINTPIYLSFVPDIRFLFSTNPPETIEAALKALEILDKFRDYKPNFVGKLMYNLTFQHRIRKCNA